MLAKHRDHLIVSRILLNSNTSKLGLGLTLQQLPVIVHNFTGEIKYFKITVYCEFIVGNNFYIIEPDKEFDSYLYAVRTPITLAPTTSASTGSVNVNPVTGEVNVISEVPRIVTDPNAPPQPDPKMAIEHVIKSLIAFLSQESSQPLWNYEDITAKGISIFHLMNLRNFWEKVIILMDFLDFN